MTYVCNFMQILSLVCKHTGGQITSCIYVRHETEYPITISRRISQLARCFVNSNEKKQEITLFTYKKVTLTLTE